MVLEQGEKHRDKLDSDRWRASFDLAMGRVLAMRVRAFGYNSVLAEMRRTRNASAILTTTSGDWSRPRKSWLVRPCGECMKRPSHT